MKLLIRSGSISHCHNADILIASLWFVANKFKLLRQSRLRHHHRRLQFQSAIFSLSLVSAVTMLKTGRFTDSNICLCMSAKTTCNFLFQNLRRKRNTYWWIPMDGSLGVFETWDNLFFLHPKRNMKWLKLFVFNWKYLANNRKGFHCGGVLINSRYVLTGSLKLLLL